MATVAIIGAGLGGLPTAYELRQLLPAEHRVILISEADQFTFIPGLIRVGLDLDPLEDIQLDLHRLAARHRLEFIHGRVSHLDPHRQRLTAGEQTLDYDYAVIATGAHLAFEEMPGLGPHHGYTQSVCTADHALEARRAWRDFLKHPGPLVVGAVPQAGCFGPAYEFLLLAEQQLRLQGLRDQVEITYVTPEPYAGHLGVGGLHQARELTEGLMRQRGIRVIDNAAIAQVEPEAIHLADGRRLPFRYAMILPNFQGVSFVRESGLGNARGFVPVNDCYQHPEFPSIYALGVSVQLSQPEKTPVPIGLPKSGQMTEAMGLAVAHNIAVSLGAIAGSYTKPTLEALCFAEYGETGIVYIAVPAIPDPVKGRKRAYAWRGRWVNWAKANFETYFLLKMKLGLGVPWFERWGLRVLFQIDLIRPLPPEPTDGPPALPAGPEVVGP